VQRTFNAEGILTQTNDLGDVATGADDRCTRCSYARNDAKWMLTHPSQVETVAVACSVTPKPARRRRRRHARLLRRLHRPRSGAHQGRPDQGRGAGRLARGWLAKLRDAGAGHL
jgi:hypothetical protein